MKTNVDAEALKYEIDGDNVTITATVSVTVSGKQDEKGIMAALRNEMGKSVTSLSSHLTQAKRFSQGETVIGIATTQPENRPYRVPTYTFGEEVPGFPWTAGPMPDQIKKGVQIG